MRLLARREYAAAELRDKLVQRGYDGAVVERVVAALGAARLQDDERFVDAFVRSRVGRGQGPARIAAELRQRGIPEGRIAEAIEAAADWRALARDARRRRFGTAAPTDWGARAKQARFLEQRGFLHDHVRAALGDDQDYD